MTKFKLIFNLGFIKEAVSSLIPTVFAYADIFQKTFSLNEAVGLAFLTFIGLFFILIFIKVREYQRSVSKALANSYNKNFVEKLIAMLNSKGKNEIDFIFENSTRKFSPQNIVFNVYLPETQEVLESKNAEIRKLSELIYVNSNAFNHPFFVSGVVAGDKLIIHEIPRTLLSLKYYIDPQAENDQQISKETKKFYVAFNEEFKVLWSRLDRASLSANLIPLGA